MPIFAYFAITGPVLLGLLLALSAYFEAEKVPPAVSIGTVNARSASTAHVVVADEDTHFLRLKQFPLR